MDEIEKVAKVAGISKSKGLIQSIVYSEEWLKDDYKLLELSPQLIECLKDERVLTIRGDGDDNAVLCTSKATYEIKAADTSNALLLLPNLSTPKDQDFPQGSCLKDSEVRSCFTSYYEVRETRPKLQRLKYLLEENAYCGENSEQREKFSLSYLENLIQASRNEILDYLRYIGAVDTQGMWQVLHKDYQEKAFAQILFLVEEKCWECSKVPLVETADALKELYPAFVIEHCLKRYGSRLENDDVISYNLDEVKVCSFYAEYILRQTQGKFNYNEFMEAWKQSVPVGMEVNTDYLRGIALSDVTSHPPVIWYFCEKDLPDDPADRFNKLFKSRSKWKHEDLEPFIKPLLAPGQKLSALLLKFTRSSTDEQGVKLYSSRKPLS